MPCGFNSAANATCQTIHLKYDEAFNQNDAEAVVDLFTADAFESGPEEAVSGQQEIEDRCKVLFEPYPNGHATKISAKPRSAHSLSEATGRAAANPFPGLIRPPNFDLEELRKPLKSRRR